MDLETLLPTIHSLQDLRRLVATLGHQPLWDEVPEQPGSRGRHFPRMTVVGQTGELPWWALESSTPARDARALARRSSRRGRMSLVLALDRESRHLALAVGLGSFPVLELDLARPGPEAVASLARLAGADEGGSLAFLARAADALAAETVGRRFFREFRSTLDRMAAGLPGPMHREDRHGLALLQLTRVLFLYFIQTKGWLGGRDRFLMEGVDRCLARGRRIHRDLLRPLFFGTLNSPMEVRSRAAAAFGAIPFLNGGLFEPHALERRFRADIPNPLWQDAFDRLFERFHFTVAEHDRRGRVAPDMLGRVFEGVMDPEARRASGTFYTPASLVGAVLDAAMTALLAGRIGCTESEAERHLRDPGPAAARALSSLTLLDPAVGSGAFLLGALDRLSAVGPGRSPSARKRRVLRHNLFGVDQSAAAVRLTELRLWLAVIADDPAEQARDVEPLPNLDCLIRQGDSLFDPFAYPVARHPRSRELVRELSDLRRAVVTASGSGKRALVRRLQAVERRAVAESLLASQERANDDIAECLMEARQRNLFGQSRGLDREIRARLGHLRSRLREIRRVRRRLSREGEVPWFHYHSHFADIFDRGGFDLVVGNPPWLRSEEIPTHVRSRLAVRYRWWRAAPGYGKRPDLAVAFLERAIELAAPAGVVAMLVPAKILSARYAVAARHALAGATTLHVIADLTNDARAGFDATVYPLALVVSKTAPTPGHRARTTLAPSEKQEITQEGLRGGGPWILVRDRLRRVVETLLEDHPTIGERFTCHLGVKTGSNHVFLNPPDDLEPEVLRWAIRGRDVTPFRYEPRTRLLWTHDSKGNPRHELPERCAAYLKRHQAELRARRDFTGGPVWAVFRARPAVARHRVVWADLSRSLSATALTCAQDIHCIPLNSCYVAAANTVAEAERLAAWLNCTWVRAAARLQAVPAAGGFARFNARTVATLPFPISAAADSELTRLARAARLGRAVQEELDRIAAVHLNLSSGAQSALRDAFEGRTPHHR
ncbi:MAG: Eco57I restriction-modification methylase domain-containing protein [Gemmatimonadales bacterium]